MKRIVFLVSFFVVFGFAKAQEPLPPTNDSIVFKSTVVNLGILPLGSKKTGEYTFINKSDSLLCLNQVHGICGCTETEWSDVPVSAGDSATIQVVFTAIQVGLFEKAITVHSNALNAMVILSIKGEVVEKK